MKCVQTLETRRNRILESVPLSSWKHVFFLFLFLFYAWFAVVSYDSPSSIWNLSLLPIHCCLVYIANRGCRLTVRLTVCYHIRIIPDRFEDVRGIMSPYFPCRFEKFKRERDWRAVTNTTIQTSSWLWQYMLGTTKNTFNRP